MVNQCFTVSFPLTINGVLNKWFLTNQNTLCIQVTLEQVVKKRSVVAVIQAKLF